MHLLPLQLTNWENDRKNLVKSASGSYRRLAHAHLSFVLCQWFNFRVDLFRKNLFYYLKKFKVCKKIFGRTHFASLAYWFGHKRRHQPHTNWLQTLKEFLKLRNWWNVSLILSLSNTSKFPRTESEGVVIFQTTFEKKIECMSPLHIHNLHGAQICGVS